MKDLDLDELHQAVSEMMDQKGKPKRRPVAAKPVEKPEPRPAVTPVERAVPKPEIKPIASQSTSADRGTPVTVRRPGPRLMPKSRGMAMDVVQAPKPVSIAPPSAQSGRTARTLQPPVGTPKPTPPAPRTTDTPKPPMSATADVSDDTLASINLQSDGAAHPVAVPMVPPQATEQAFPDPLDVHGFSDEPAAKPAPAADQEFDFLKDDEPDLTAAKNQWDMPHEEPSVAEAPAPAPEAPSLNPVPTEEPSATPFLKAKVTKRPLGAYAETAAPAEQLLPAPQAELELPAGPPPEPATTPEPAAPEAEPQPEPEPAEEPKTHDAAPLDNLRQMSIPPQYHATQKEPSKAERPVFDTKNYHTPIQPPASAPHATGSRAGAVISIVLILILIAAGVVAYFVATGGIDVTKILGK